MTGYAQAMSLSQRFRATARKGQLVRQEEAVDAVDAALEAAGATRPPIDASAFKTVMSQFATGVTVVTATTSGGPVGFTCQSFVSLSLDPPLIALAPARTSTTWPLISQAGAFCVNVLSQRQEALCRAFSVSGVDKFAGVEWVPGDTGAPRLPDSLAWIECSVELIHDAGDHELVLGKVVSLDRAQGEPLLFFQSRFATVGEGERNR